MKVFHKFQHEITGEVIEIEYIGHDQYQISPLRIRSAGELSNMNWIRRAIND